MTPQTLTAQSSLSGTLADSGVYTVVNQAAGTFTWLPPVGRQLEEVNVAQPSAALTAQVDAQGAFDVLFLGLGAVALLVGAVGVANVMVISVLERRSEIGLRRALGATKCHIAPRRPHVTHRGTVDPLTSTPRGRGPAERYGRRTG